MSDFLKDFEKLHFAQKPDGTVVLPEQRNDNHRPLSEVQKRILIRDRYVILASGSQNKSLKLYYEYPTGIIGTTNYPKPHVPKSTIEFNFMEIVHLRNYLCSLPFGQRLVENMERSVISVGTFHRIMSDFYRAH